MVRRRKAEPEPGEQTEAILLGSRPVHVFDIRQTDGDDLPPSPASQLTGEDVTGSYDRLIAVAHLLGYTVEEDYLPGGTNGVTTLLDRKIRIEVRNEPAQQVKTLVHEIAHTLLHEDGQTVRALAELEAESVAYVVCEGLGLDSSAYSFGYVASWSGGGDEATAGIQHSGQRIATTARAILDHLDSAAAEQS